MHIARLCVLGRYQYQRAEKDLQAHRHPGMMEICYYEKGSQLFAVGKEQYVVKGGDVFIHFPGEEHGSGGFPEEKGRLYWLILQMPGASVRSGPDAGVDYLLQQLVRPQKRHFRGSSELKKYLEAIFMLMRGQSPGSYQEAGNTKKIGSVKNTDETERAARRQRGSNTRLDKNILAIRLRLLVQQFLLAVLEKRDTKQQPTDNARLQQVLQWIESRLTEEVSISMLAREANLSESRFKAWFKELSGYTPLDYVQRRRVQLALERIAADPGVSLKGLAYELNFSSQQYFSAVVKKFTGHPPFFFSRKQKFPKAGGLGQGAR